MTKRSRVIMYKVASASEYLAITGLGIREIKLAKKAWIFPGQSCIRFDLTPVNYTFDVMAMSVEKLPFVLPTVFTIGPRADDEESLLKYTKLIISPHDQILSKELIKELVKKIVEGETRILTYSTSIEEVFRGTKEFKRELFRNVEIELNRFGLLIYNANVKHLGDVPGLDYVSYMAKMGVSEACKLLRKAVKIDDKEKVVSINDPD